MRTDQRARLLRMIDDPVAMKKIKTLSLVLPEDRDILPTTKRIAKAHIITAGQLRESKRWSEWWEEQFPLPKFENED